MFLSTLVFYLVAAVTAETEETKNGKSFSVLNVVRFPNTDCMGSGSLNGTCYTASECTSLGGTAAGACASSFGVCCVFSLSCGGTTSQNGSYAMISSFSTTSDTSPCTYKYCKNNDDICKLRIDYETMVLAGPETTATAFSNGLNMGRCDTDILTVGVPGFGNPPTICGFNTGQHMWVPASDSCVTLTLDIDTAATATTRSWNIKVTQYECGNLMAPEDNCLQYHTASTGTIASFNWDTSQTSNTQPNLATQFHLADQNYDICIRRTRGFCSICYSPQIAADTNTANTGSSFGVSSSSTTTTDTFMAVALGPQCLGTTTHNALWSNAIGLGDYLSIMNLQPSTTAAAGIAGEDKICGIIFSADASKVGAAAGTTAAQATACSFKTPFRVGVHFDSTEAIGAPADAAVGTNDAAWKKVENAALDPSTGGEGIGYNGFWLAYWQNTC